MIGPVWCDGSRVFRASSRADMFGAAFPNRQWICSLSRLQLSATQQVCQPTLQRALLGDDDMSSWSSAFDPLPPPPETPESTRKKRRKVKKNKKAKKEPKVKSRKRRRRRRRSSLDEEPVSTRDEQMPRETAREQQVPETTAAFPSSTRPEDQGRWVSRLSGSRLIWAQHRQSPVRAGQLRKCWSGQA